MQWIKSFFFFTLIAFTGNAYAEYYFVYPAPAVACIGPCYDRPHHRVHHYKKKPRCHKYKVHRVVKKPCKKIVVPCVPACSYGCRPACPPHPCNPCNPWVYREPAWYGYDYYYNPDLATGDDYQILHPDLNIDY